MRDDRWWEAPRFVHVRALRAFHENYKWQGVLLWMRSDVRVPAPPGVVFTGRGVLVWLRHPEAVWAWQDAVADGVCS